jgi:hypothetical protein
MHFQPILVTLAAVSLSVAYSAPVPASGSSASIPTVTPRMHPSLTDAPATGAEVVEEAAEEEPATTDAPETETEAEVVEVSPEVLSAEGEPATETPSGDDAAPPLAPSTLRRRSSGGGAAAPQTPQAAKVPTLSEPEALVDPSEVEEESPTTDAPEPAMEAAPEASGGLPEMEEAEKEEAAEEEEAAAEAPTGTETAQAPQEEFTQVEEEDA